MAVFRNRSLSKGTQKDRNELFIPEMWQQACFILRRHGLQSENDILCCVILFNHFKAAIQ